MNTATQPPAADVFEAFVLSVVEKVVDRINYDKLREPKLAYTPDEVADLVGFTNGLAVEREANSGRLCGSKVRNKWRFTPEQIREFLKEHEVVK